MMNKTALITGINGQDGYYLKNYLLTKNYKIVGFDRGEVDLDNIDEIKKYLSEIKLDEIYNLAALSHVGDSFKNPDNYFKVNTIFVVNLLQSYFELNKNGKFFQASSSSIYSLNNPYAISKKAAHDYVSMFRNKYDFFAVNGILFNHESPKRASTFLTQKVALSVAYLSLGIDTSKELNEEGEPILNNGKIKLGNLDSQRDWGYAGDYVEAMHLMLQNKMPNDYEIATGENHTVKELLEIAFNYANLDYRDYIEIDERFKRKSDNQKDADIKPILKDLNWKPKHKFKELIETMVEENIQRLRNS